MPVKVLDDTVAANVIDRALRAAVELGASRPVLLAALGVDEARLRHPLGRLSSNVLVRLLTLIDRELKDPAIILKLSFVSGPSCFSDIGYVGRYARDLAEGLETQVRNQTLRQNIFSVALDRKRNPPQLRWTVDPARLEYLGPALEFTLGAYVGLCREIATERMPVLQQICFEHEPRFDPEIYEQTYGCPVIFEAEQTALEFHPAALVRPARNANPQLVAEGARNYNRVVQWMDERRECSAHGYFYLSTELNKTPPTLERMASAFGMTERTLRRRLQTEGNSFRDLLDQVRRDMCTLYKMEGSRSLGEVALLLGYSELSAFTRAYRRWYGRSPRSGWAQ